jgi:hypothetical protein
MRHASTKEMITKLAGMLGTHDLSGWEQDFVRTLQRRVEAGEVTALTSHQVDKLDELHHKHFS